MKGNNKYLVLRILIAVCFLWMPVNGVRSFIYSNVLPSGNILAIIIALVPAIGGVVLLIGALTGSRIVIGVGAVIRLLYEGFSIFTYISQLEAGVPDEVKKSVRSLIISSVLVLLALLFLALACFIKRSDLALCILALVLFVVWFFVRRSGYAAGQSLLPLILTAGGAAVGTLLLAAYMAFTKKKKEA